MRSLNHLISTVAVLFTTINFIFVYCDNLSELGLLKKYDFIIVGAGSSGSVVANRLSENKHINVLLLEAGVEEDPILNEMPCMALSLIGSPNDWMIWTEPQTSPFFWNTNKTFLYTRGKVLGGCSAFNWLLYIRGNRRDYEAWNDDVDGGWSWNDVLRAFLKSEDCQFQTSEKDYHQSGGLLTVTESNVANSLSDVLFKAGEELGLTVRDTNGQFQTGIMKTQNTIRNGARCSTNKAFLKSARGRKNLHIVTEARVLRVLFNSDSEVDKPRAIGVEFIKNGRTYSPLSRKEVILSAGALNSPQLLLLSGIGHKEHLDEFSIPLVTELKGVGLNLHDHGFQNTIVYVKEINHPESQQCLSEPNFQENLKEWSINHTGSLSNPIIDVIAFTKSSLADQNDDWPDLLYGFTPPTTVYGPGNKAFLAFQCISVVAGTKSVGFVKLRSKNPLALPILDPRYLSDKDDVKLIIEGTKWCLSLEHTEAFKRAGLHLNMAAIARCVKYDKKSDDFAHCISLQDFFAGMHACGTCKMGKDSDPLAVVDKELKVLNVTGLRIIDTSIMPNIIRGTTNAPAIMIGERGSRFIKSYWNITDS